MREYGLDSPLSNSIKRMYLCWALRFVNAEVGQLVSELARCKFSSPVGVKRADGLDRRASSRSEVVEARDECSDLSWRVTA